MEYNKNLNALLLDKLNILYKSEEQLIYFFQVLKSKFPEKLHGLFNLLENLTNQSSRNQQFLLSGIMEINSNFQEKSCYAVNGLIKEVMAVLKISKDPDMQHYAVINFLQHICNYKIENLQSGLLYADAMNYHALRNILNQLLKEERELLDQIDKFEKFTIGRINGVSLLEGIR